MADAAIDSNSRAAITAVSNVDGKTIIRLYADPSTHRLLVDLNDVISITGTAALLNGTATTAGGATTPGLTMGTALLGVYFGSGAPTIAAPQGSVYLRTDGSTTNNRMYVNTDNGTTWTAVTTAA